MHVGFFDDFEHLKLDDLFRPGQCSVLQLNEVDERQQQVMVATLLRRLLLRYFLFDFSMVSVYLLTGIPLILFGLIFGSVKWIQYLQLGVPAPTGTVILPTLALILGIQILLSAIEIDMNAAPKTPRSQPLL